VSALEGLDPELAAALDACPPGFMWWNQDLSDLDIARREVAELRLSLLGSVPDEPGVAKEDDLLPGDVPVRVYRPAASAPARPATLLWFHGGGYIMGSVDQDDVAMQQLCAAVGCVVVSVEYRLAPEHPFPAAIEDGRAALDWVRATLDPERLAIGGISAGGGLAAGLTLAAAEAGQPPAFQLLVFPMIDDTCSTPSCRRITDPRVWNDRSNRMGWEAYLGDLAGGAVPATAAATRATDEQLAALPPTYIAVGELDPFLDENITYAQRLLAAGVPTELHVYPGAFHGWNVMAPKAAISRRFLIERNDALRRGIFPVEVCAPTGP
jgi:acetyl esterase/lipase